MLYFYGAIPPVIHTWHQIHALSREKKNTGACFLTNLHLEFQSFLYWLGVPFQRLVVLTVKNTLLI